jgi:regulator of protease activity HflC (stomatin/prohibitin superfamily)
VGALAWISELVAWIAQFIPRFLIVEATHGGVKFVRGSKIVKLDAGFHIYWPLTTSVHLYPIARQADDLRSQTIVTADDKTIVVGGMIVYEVDDVEKILAHTFQPEQTIRDVALSAFHDVCCQLTWQEIRDQQRSGQLDRDLKREVRKSLDSYGIRVLKTMLTDLAPCKVLKLIQSTSSDGQ